MSLPVINPATSDEVLQNIVQQWMVSSDPLQLFKDATCGGFHALRFANAVQKHMVAHNDFSLFPRLFAMLEGEKTGGFGVSYLNFIAGRIFDDPNSFHLLKTLTHEQQDNIIPLILESRPQIASKVEEVIGRPIPEEVIFTTLCTNLNNLQQMKELSSRISSEFFFNRLSKVFHTNYPTGGVKLFAYWLAVPGYNLKLSPKEYKDFNNMFDFLNEQTIDDKNLGVLSFARGLLDMKHDTTKLTTFIERAKIFNAIPQVSTTHKRKM